MTTMTTATAEAWTDETGRWHARVPVRPGKAVGTTLIAEGLAAAYDAIFDTVCDRHVKGPVKSLSSKPTEVTATSITYSEEV